MRLFSRQCHLPSNDQRTCCSYDDNDDVDHDDYDDTTKGFEELKFIKTGLSLPPKLYNRRSSRTTRRHLHGLRRFRFRRLLLPSASTIFSPQFRLGSDGFSADSY